MSDINRFVPDIIPGEAWGILAKNSNAFLIDVREYSEIKSDGRPNLKSIGKSSNLIPWRSNPDFSASHEFVKALTDNFPDKENSILFFLCKAGFRSHMATEAAMRAGYKHCFNIKNGFEGSINKNGEKNQISGWKFSELPWEKV